jgi:hypothetical protein
VAFIGYPNTYILALKYDAKYNSWLTYENFIGKWLIFSR